MKTFAFVLCFLVVSAPIGESEAGFAIFQVASPNSGDILFGNTAPDLLGDGIGGFITSANP